MNVWNLCLLGIALLLAIDVAFGFFAGRTPILLSANKATAPTSFYLTLAMGALCVVVLAWAGFSADL